MIKIELASENTLRKALDGSMSEFLCTPFFSRDGLRLVEQHLAKPSQVDIVLRANIYDWVTGYGDLTEMRGFLEGLRESNVVPSLFIVSNLHAKIYVGVTKKRAYFGSANLSAAAFQSNVEIMTFTDGADSDPIIEVVDQIKANALAVSFENFNAMIDVTKDTVVRAARTQKQSFESDPDFDVAVQLFSTELQKHVIRRKRATKTSKSAVLPDEYGDYTPLPAPWPTIVEFLTYCGEVKSSVAREIVDRFEGKNNLQGHIKHIFYGCLFFFFEHPSYIESIPHDLAKRDHVNWADEPWLAHWKSYLSRHKGEFYKNIAFSYHSLITYLPASLGGVQVTGGASSGNFKKILPLLARMLRDRIK
ncbi:MAG: phospholipase D-like domain-containing protein [Candidatus Zixiibacteriota bacterium]